MIVRQVVCMIEYLFKLSQVDVQFSPPCTRMRAS